MHAYVGTSVSWRSLHRGGRKSKAVDKGSASLQFPTRVRKIQLGNFFHTAENASPLCILPGEEEFAVSLCKFSDDAT